MSHLNPGLLSAYNSLTDRHLAGYFSNSRIRRHLQRAGLITRSGRIVPDKEYKHKLIQRSHQRHVRECLAQAIFHKVLEMERLHQIEIKRKLEEFSRKERVHRLKVERSRRYEEDIHILSPRPPLGARNLRKHSGPEAEHSESSDSPSSSRPNTAPGKMQRPVRLKPIHSSSTTASVRRSAPYRVQESPHENDRLLSSTLDKKSRRHLTTMETSHGTSPYCLPVINNFVTPVPPVTKRREGSKVAYSSTVRGRRLQPTTASSRADDPPWLRSSVHQTKVRVNMVYFGKTVHLTSDLLDMTDKVKVFQQHCGGENLCVFKGHLHEGEAFQFVSRRHRGFPFSLTFYLNGLQVERLSSCCEFKHRKGSRLGGRHGHFGFSSVEGASPCYRCIIAMGLDKKPTPPPRSVKEEEQPADSPTDAPEMETDRTKEEAASHSESDSRPIRDPETHSEEQTAAAGAKVRDGYEEDFEADDEGPVDEATVKEEKSPSPFGDSEKQVQERDASETDDDGDDGSSVSGSDQEVSDAEDPNESKKDEKADEPTEEHQEEAALQADERDEEGGATKVESAFDSAGESTEIETYDTSAASGNENKQNDHTSEDKTNEETGNETKTEGEQERVKSVQEKLTEAILKESQCSFEPELSDTSTEEEEGSTDKDPKQDNKGEQQTLTEESKPEESVTDEEARGQRESPEPEEGEDDEQPPRDSRESTKEEKVSEVEEDEKAADAEATAEADESEETGEAQLRVEDEGVAQDDRTADPFEGGQSADASESDEEREERADVHPDETGQRAKSPEEGESSALEPSTKTDEAAGPDDAEAEATAASQTMEIKAESSEEQEPLSCEKAPEADAERRQQPDDQDKTAASETEVTGEDLSSSPEEAGDSTGEKTADIHEEPAGDNDEMKETSEADERKDDNEQEERIETPEEESEKTERQEEDEEEKQTHLNSDEKTDDENTEEKEQDKTEEINDENMDKNTANGPENDGEEDEAADEEITASTENTEEEEKPENDENPESVDVQSVREEAEEEGGDKKDDDGRTETHVTSEETDDGAGKSEEENRVTESENDEERKDVTEDGAGERGEVSEITEELEKVEDADRDEEQTEGAAQSEDVRDSEAAAEETPNVPEDEDVQGETAGGSEKGEIDAENGEISFADESKPDEDEEEEEAPAKEKNDSETEEQAEEEGKSEEAAEDESMKVKEVTVESGDGAEKHEENIDDQDPDTEKPEESTKPGSELETSKDPSLDDRKDNEGTGEEDDDKTGTDHGNKELEFINDNTVENDLSEAGPSADQVRSSAPVDDAAADTENLLDEVELEPEKLPDADGNLPEVPAADRENGEEVEEASKASEEGASVLLKPEGNKEAEQSVAVETEPSEALESQDNTDLVTEWIKMHQTSKYFETFVEPLEDLSEEVSDVKGSNSDIKESSTDVLRAESALRPGDEDDLRDKTQTGNPQSEDDRGVNDPIGAELRGDEENEENEVKIFTPHETTDQSGPEGAAEGQDGAEEENTCSKTKVESLSGSFRAESVLKNQRGEEVTSNGSDLNVRRVSLKTEENQKSEGSDEPRDTEETHQVTQISSSSAAQSADGNQKESQPEDKTSGETKDLQLSEDLKDHLSSEPLFGP